MKYNVSARGVLEKNNEILFVVYKDSRGVIYALPGGSQNVNEDLISTLKREFKEETSLDVEPEDIVLVREFILETSEFELWRNGIHQVEIIFRCKQKYINQEAFAGTIPDYGMNDLKWISLNEMKDLRIYPTKELNKILNGKGITYLFSNE